MCPTRVGFVVILPHSPWPNACACKRVDIPDGTYTLTQEEEGAASGEVNQLSVQQDLDQSPEEPKACLGVESEEGKHRFHLTHFYKLKSCPLFFSTLYFTLCI
jgi:hypothetical protein